MSDYDITRLMGALERIANALEDFNDNLAGEITKQESSSLVKWPRLKALLKDTQ